LVLGLQWKKGEGILPWHKDYIHACTYESNML
jgi:hypothetical protein